MSGNVIELPEISIEAAKPDPDLPLPPPKPKAPTPRQRARTAAAVAPAEAPPPAPPDPPGPELDFPIDTTVQPRAGVLLTIYGADGSVTARRADHLLENFTVTNNRFFSPDTFSMDLAVIEGDPEWGRAVWADSERIEVNIFVGFGTTEQPSKSLIEGRIDDARVDPDEGSVSISGRDYTADLVERRLTEKWPNKTASEIVREIAGIVHMEADVEETEVLAGTFYGREHAQMADETTAWNLITFLAERSDFDAFVQGRTIVFKRPPQPQTASRWIMRYTPRNANVAIAQAKAPKVIFSKGYTVSRDIDVKVISWGSGKKHSITGQARSTRPSRGNGGRFGGTTSYVYRIPNLTLEQANQIAAQKAQEITKDLRSFEASNLPGHPDMDIRTIVVVQGSGDSFDTEYHLDEITRSMSFKDGFTMSLRARNVIPEDTAAL